MKVVFKSSMIAALLMGTTLVVSSCGSIIGPKNSSGTRPTPKKKTTDAPIEDVVIDYADIPAGEVNVFGKTDLVFGKDKLECDTAGYGLALSPSLTKMAVCCVHLDQSKLASGSVKFASIVDGRVKVKPERCSAVAIDGSAKDIALPVDLDLSGQVLATISEQNVFAGITGTVSIKGNEAKPTKFIGQNEVLVRGKAELKNLLLSGTSAHYVAIPGDGNNLAMKNVKVETANNRTARLILEREDKYTVTDSDKVTFENVTVVADVASPVLLDGHPFKTDGLMIVKGKFHPHIGFEGKYEGTTGNVSETRYPVVVKSVTGNRGFDSVLLMRNSVLSISPGVLLKLGEKGFNSDYNSKLLINGIAENPVVITSFQDDRANLIESKSINGDSNGDGGNSIGGKILLAYWAGAPKMNLVVNHAKFYGVQIQEDEMTVQISDSDFQLAQDNRHWDYTFFAGRSSDWTFGGRISLVQPIQNIAGKPSAAMMIYDWPSTVTGLELLNITNPITENAIDALVIAGRSESCSSSIKAVGESLEAIKKKVYFYSRDPWKLTPCL